MSKPQITVYEKPTLEQLKSNSNNTIVVLRPDIYDTLKKIMLAYDPIVVELMKNIDEWFSLTSDLVHRTVFIRGEE